MPEPETVPKPKVDLQAEVATKRQPKVEPERPETLPLPGGEHEAVTRPVRLATDDPVMSAARPSTVEVDDALVESAQIASGEWQTAEALPAASPSEELTLEPVREDETIFDPRTPPPAPLSSEPLAIRQAGLLGDVRYAFSVVFGMARDRKELGGMRERLARERAERARRLLDIAKTALADATLAHPLLVSARRTIEGIAEERQGRRESAGRAQTEAEKHDGERAASNKAGAAKLEKIAGEVERIEGRLRPLERDALERRKALDTLRGQLAEVERKIAALDRRTGAARDASERASIDAELAVRRAEKQDIVAEEPNAQAAIAELTPQIAELETKLAELKEAARRTSELTASEDARLVHAARTARERRAAEVRAESDLAAAEIVELRALGEALDRERPREIAMRFRPVDEHSAAIGMIERRILEIEDASAGVHRPALFRGIALMAAALILAAVLLGLLL